jgi:translation initiation factor 2 beta subunit (eIF-2beta)/eIF-5
MSSPEYLICLECETPCYIFEWHDGELTEVLCEACGNDEPDQFATPEDYDAMS